MIYNKVQWSITKEKIHSLKKSSIANLKTIFPFLYSKYIDSYIPRCLRIWRPGGNHWLNNEKGPMLIKTFKILQNSLCCLWLRGSKQSRASGRSMDNPVTQASLSAERFDLRHPCPTQSRELAAVIDTTNEEPFTNVIPNQTTILIISNSPK